MSNGDSFYSTTPNRLIITQGTLKGEHSCDVCIIGANITGISAALELSEKGFSVLLLDKKNSSNFSTGKLNGQLLRGYNTSTKGLIKQHGKNNAKLLHDFTLEGLATILNRISKYDISCDIKFGAVKAAISNKHLTAMEKEFALLKKMGHENLELLDRKRIRDFVKSTKYVGGVYDAKEAHFHPLNYALGIAQAAQAAGCKIYDETSVIAISNNKSSSKIITVQGSVNAKFIVLAGRIKLKETKKINSKAINSIEHILATKPLDSGALYDILPKNITVSDSANNYFHLSSDNRLIFGGNCIYNNSIPSGQKEIIHENMVNIFPVALKLKTEYCWIRTFDTTISRMPNIGKLRSNIFYATAFGNKDIIMSDFAGKMIALAINGTAKKFDIFAKIKHDYMIDNPPALKKCFFYLATQWYRLQDLL